MVIRKCYMLCNLLGWHEQAAGFDRELNGYRPEEQVPAYRIVNGIREWEAESGLEGTRAVSADYVGGSNRWH